MKADNAIIMAAGISSRFVPFSYEIPKGLLTVKGEVLIERQIRQLREAGIEEIVVVIGYMKEKFQYLQNKFGVVLVDNPEYRTRNNNSSIYAVRDYLKNSYVCSSDNYFAENPFTTEVDGSYYAAVFADGETKEWCMTEDENGFIDSVQIGGYNAWYMLGHTFWSEDFSRKFLDILLDIYDRPETEGLLWESIFLEHLDELKMKVNKYPQNVIFEFDTFEELREFDSTYLDKPVSTVLKAISKELSVDIKNMTTFMPVYNGNEVSGFSFLVNGKEYQYDYLTKELR